jgi:hypothetical protein
LEFQDLVKSTNHRKEATVKVLNEIVRVLIKNGMDCVPSDPKDANDGYKCLKRFVLNEQELLKQGHENIASRHTRNQQKCFKETNNKRVHDFHCE